jgi:hypothetical protein
MRTEREAGAPDLCPLGCYWECEHRAPSSDERAGELHPVHDEAGRPLSRCRECGDFFYDVMEHSREHARKRQLGWLPDGLPAEWPSMGGTPPEVP